MRRVFLFGAIISTMSLSAQVGQLSKEKIKVFLDCTSEWLCDFDYVRSQMKMVDFVRDRMSADVHVLVITQFTSSGGEQSQLNFLGQGQFNNQNDTLVYFNDPTRTQDEKRKLLTQFLKLGLARYFARSSIAETSRLIM